MQAILLAAGSSSRFYPFNGTHKSMVYLLGKPILAHAIDGLRSIGIKELIIVVRDDGIVKDYFGDGKKFGVEINYVVINQPLGMGDALLQAKKHLKGDFIFLGGNHVNSNILVSKLLTNRKNTDAVVLINQRLNTWEYGVVKLVGQQVKGVVEKPKKGQEPSKFCLVSIYLLPINFLAVLEKTKVHQYNFEEALDEFTKIAKVAAVEIKEEIATLKYPWDLLNVKNMLLKKMKDYRGKNVKIAKSAEIIGEVSISDGVVIMEGVRIKGPAYLGKNVTVGNNALLRGGVDVEEGSVVGSYMEVKNSLVMKNSTTHSGFIGDSVVGEACKIGAQFCTANVRIDRKTIHDSGRKFLGVIMGNNVHIGIKSSTMPGVIIGNNATIGPSTTVLQNVSDDSRYYTKFEKIVEEKN